MRRTRFAYYIHIENVTDGDLFPSPQIGKEVIQQYFEEIVGHYKPTTHYLGCEEGVFIYLFSVLKDEVPGFNYTPDGMETALQKFLERCMLRLEPASAYYGMTEVKYFGEIPVIDVKDIK